MGEETKGNTSTDSRSANNVGNEKNGEKADGGVKFYTLEEVRVHNVNNDTWLIIHNKVYDISSFLEEVRSTFYQYTVLEPSSLLLLSSHNLWVLTLPCVTLLNYLHFLDVQRFLAVCCVNLVLLSSVSKSNVVFLNNINENKKQHLLITNTVD